MWTTSDSSALHRVFNFCWECFNTEFQVLGYTTSWWKLMVSCFAVYLIFKIARGIFEI